MIPILNAEQIREADAYTIKNEPIPSIDLMERASHAFLRKFMEFSSLDKEIIVFAGVGNNGGDGLAVARMLKEKGRTVQIYYVGKLEKASDDFSINYQRLIAQSPVFSIKEEADIPTLSGSEMVIDCLFGSGLTRAVGGLHAKVIEKINSSGAVVFSMDVPSGLYVDQPTKEGAIVKADYTITFQTPKLSFLQPSQSQYVGEWQVVDIGLDENFIYSVGSKYGFTEAKDIVLPRRGKFHHKGEAGRMLLIAGSKGKMGAATLSARAAMRSGCGLLHIHTPCCGLDILQINVPEAMVETDEHTEVISEILPKPSINVIAIGPGIGTSQLTRKALMELMGKVDKPMVMDADAINIMAENRELLVLLPPESVLTPHPGEFRRLVGDWKDDYHKLKLLQNFCQHYSVNVVLKGAFSAVCNSTGELFFNPTGNPGMATGGSGDVLTGVISALLAQGLSPFNALRSGVYIHGLAGDLAQEAFGEISLIATDIIDQLPRAFKFSEEKIRKS